MIGSSSPAAMLGWEVSGLLDECRPGAGKADNEDRLRAVLAQARTGEQRIAPGREELAQGADKSRGFLGAGKPAPSFPATAP